jgi:hypothetical protein
VCAGVGFDLTKKQKQNMNLIEKAINRPPPQYRANRVAGVSSKEEQDLALAWARGEVNLTQATYALGKESNSPTYQKLLFAFRDMLREGRIQERK